MTITSEPARTAQRYAELRRYMDAEVTDGTSFVCSSAGACRGSLKTGLEFAAGQLSRPLIGNWALRNRTLLGLVDRGSILLIVYTAFSEGVTQGIWHQLSLSDLGRLLTIDAVLLAAVLAITTYGSRLLGFSRADEVTIVFCGSKKSLASGLPIATLLFAGHVGLVVIPLMLFHQIQLMVCASLARRYAARRIAESICGPVG